jgi:hypothetical protein
MLSDKALMESVSQAALRGCDANVAARCDALWDTAVCLQSDVLRTLAAFSRERRLRTAVGS